jgi:hypothetical protein
MAYHGFYLTNISDLIQTSILSAGVTCISLSTVGCWYSQFNVIDVWMVFDTAVCDRMAS